MSFVITSHAQCSATTVTFVRVKKCSIPFSIQLHYQATLERKLRTRIKLPGAFQTSFLIRHLGFGRFNSAMYFISLDSAYADAKIFRNAGDVKDGDKIRERFKETKKPDFLFKEGNAEGRISIGEDLQPGT